MSIRMAARESRRLAAQRPDQEHDETQNAHDGQPIHDPIEGIGYQDIEPAEQGPKRIAQPPEFRQQAAQPGEAAAGCP